jgi:hypothetical protein
LEKAKTDIEIEMKQMNADVEDEETSNAGSRKNSKKADVEDEETRYCHGHES